jgi:hypothetical protein
MTENNDKSLTTIEDIIAGLTEVVCNLRAYEDEVDDELSDRERGAYDGYTQALNDLRLHLKGEVVFQNIDDGGNLTSNEDEIEDELSDRELGFYDGYDQAISDLSFHLKIGKTSTTAEA